MDDGHFGTKICLEDGTCHYMPSRAVIGLQQVVALDGTEQANAYEIATEHFTGIEDQALIDAEATTIAQQIKSMMNKLIGSGADIGNVVFVGGGSILLKEYLEAEYPKQGIFPEQPEFANARGLLKAAKYLVNNES